MDSQIFFIDIRAVSLSEAEQSTRIPIAMVGTFYKGKQRFTITRADIAQLSENLKKRGGDVVLDYEHASESPEVASGGPVPAAGWISAIDPTVDRNGIAWATATFTDTARKLIAAQEYRYISPFISWGVRDKDTGASQGITLTSAALTNKPVLDRMPAVTLSLSDAGWTAMTETERGKNMTEKVMCSEHPKTQMLCPECDKDEISQLSASEHRHEAATCIMLSDVKRDEVGQFTLSTDSLKETDMISVAAFRAWQAQTIALSEVSEAVRTGKVSPANIKAFTKIAMSDIGSFRSIVTSMVPQVDLREHGIGGDGSGESSEDRLIIFASQRAKKDSIALSEALKLVAVENPELTAGWLASVRRQHPVREE